MSRIIVNVVTHHVSSEHAEPSCDDCIDRTTMLDQRWAPSPVLVTTHWELVTCPRCHKACASKVFDLAALPLEFNLPLPVIPSGFSSAMLKTAGNFTTLPKDDWIGEWPGDATIEPGPKPAEPEREQRTEGDDLLDFFKGDR